MEVRVTMMQETSAVDALDMCHAGVEISTCLVRTENAELKRLAGLSRNEVSHCKMLMREGDHRIKNSLQVVSSLMNLQARQEESENTRLALSIAATRIQSIARMHDALQAGKGEGAVDIGVALHAMCVSLQVMAGDPQRIAVLVDADPFMAPVSLAQPVLLAVNELVLNALRHAFPGYRVGIVDVSLKRIDNKLRIVVADDGVGLPLSCSNGNGFGMQLVRMLTSEMGGVLSVESDEVGARFTIIMDIPEFARRHSGKPISVTT